MKHILTCTAAMIAALTLSASADTTLISGSDMASFGSRMTANNSYQSTSGSNVTLSAEKTSVYGKAGKETSDASVRLFNPAQTGIADFQKANNHKMIIALPTYTMPKSGYLVMEANVLPVDEYAIGDMIVQPNAGLTISPVTTLDSGAFHIGRWNAVRVIVDYSTVDTAGLVPGYTEVYVNGVKAAEGKAGKQINEAYVQPYRLTFDANLSPSLFAQHDQELYFDDVNIRITDAKPEPYTLPSLNVPDGATIENGVLHLYKRTTVNDLSASEGAEIRVYDVKTFDYRVMGSNPLYDGNVVAVVDKAGHFNYYDVVCTDTDIASLAHTGTTFMASAFLDKGILVLAAYDRDSRLAEVRTASEKGAASVSVTGHFASVSALVLDAATFTPLCSKQTYKEAQTIACWGASLTISQGCSDRNTTSYPAVLASLSGCNVLNMGIGGETAMTVTARTGGLKILLDKDVTIPASGSVPISFKAENGGIVTPRDVTLGGWNPCVLGGVEGTLSVSVDGTVWPRVLKSATFTRKASGSAVVCKAGTELSVAAQDTYADIHIFELGSNGGWTVANKSGGHNTDAECEALASLGEARAAHTGDPDHCVFISCSTLSTAELDRLDPILKAHFGKRYIDVGHYMHSLQAVKDAGLEPTSNDIDYASKGKTPPSLLNNPTVFGGNDDVHLNDAGYRVKANYIYDVLVSIGFVEEK